jgi:hypothetical protein
MLVLFDNPGVVSSGPAKQVARIRRFWLTLAAEAIKAADHSLCEGGRSPC